MTKLVALARTAPLPAQQGDVLRSAVVLFCALALIFAKGALPI